MYAEGQFFIYAVSIGPTVGLEHVWIWGHAGVPEPMPCKCGGMTASSLLEVDKAMMKEKARVEDRKS